MPNRLGLAYRAGKLAVGTERAVKAIQNRKAELILLANDASNLTIKKVTDKAKYYQVKVNQEFNTQSLSKPLGKSNIKTVAILDKGFSKMYEK
ncbi:MAG: hypothetical protein GX149_04490 [Acholeplasmataceae bacterium]|nr:hypothetical protein [Acholeplasmataceae bacterium]